MIRTIQKGALLTCLLFLTSTIGARAQTCASDPSLPVIEHDAENITTSVTWANTAVHVLQNAVEVKDGGTLTVEAGTCIFADTNLEPSTFIVRRGGQVIADGTASNPIVWSSANNTELYNVGTEYQDAAGTPDRGDWGGIVLIGNGICNGAGDTTDDTPADGVAGDCEVEGLDSTVPGLEDFDATDADSKGRLTFGGDTNIPGGQGLNNAESSGSMTFNRIEYAGFDLLGSIDPQNSGNELNVLVLAGVGSGTTIENVHVRYGLDDGIEIFGGGVNIKNIVFSNIADDSFDYSYGWDGSAQFLLIQLPAATDGGGDRAFEVDGNEAEFDADGANDYQLTPLTGPQVYNVTVVGDDGGDALTLRRGTAGQIRNMLVSAVGDGLDVDDAETFDGCTGSAAGDLFLDHITFNDGTITPGTTNLYDTDSDNENTCTGANVAIGLALLPSAATNRAAPDFQPLAGIAGATPPDNGFLDLSATFRGAVPSGGAAFYNLGSWVRF